MDDSQAGRAGVQAGDVICAVNGENAAGRSVCPVSVKLRGAGAPRPGGPRARPHARADPLARAAARPFAWPRPRQYARSPAARRGARSPLGRGRRT
ncbi:PDZ domain-containing protein, partial [Salmonella enterica]|uniref:PDZ domain-containing protein n=1 Tax=Salmonella enterica TaxID=28901 RepID=UPI001AEC400B